VAALILTNSVKVFLSLTSSATSIVVCVIDDSHFDWGAVESQCSFDLQILLKHDI
jgi:hypothetical protein